MERECDTGVFERFEARGSALAVLLMRPSARMQLRKCPVSVTVFKFSSYNCHVPLQSPVSVYSQFVVILQFSLQLPPTKVHYKQVEKSFL